MIDAIYLAADVADCMRQAGCRMTTPAAVRSAIEDGRLSPDLRSPRGVKAWSQAALMRDVDAQYRRDRMRASMGRVALREPQQLLLRG